MTFWRRAPREVYRVYGQDEYLSEDGPPAAETPSPTSPAGRPQGFRSGRLVGLGVLIGVSVGALGLVVAHVSRQAPAAQRAVVGQSARLGAARRRSDASRASGASRASVHPPASANSASGTYPARVPLPRASAALRPQVRSLGRPPGRSPSKRPSSGAWASQPWPSVVAAELSRSRLATSDAAVPGTGSSAVDGEFDFER